MNKKEIPGVVIRCLIALVLFVLAIVFYDELSAFDVTRIAEFTDNLWIMTAMILAIYFVKALLFVLPASVIYVAVGAIMNPWLAVAVNLLGILIEVSVTYVLGHFLGYSAVHRFLSKKEAGKKLLEKDIQSKTSVLLTIRAVPAFPIDFVSLLYGAAGTPFIKYALLSVAGISWRVILFTLLGDAIFDWIPMDKIILILICMIPVGIIYYLIKKFKIDPAKAKKNEPDHSK